MRRIQQTHHRPQRQADKLRVRSLLTQGEQLRRELEHRR